ncbi:MAG: hypothetical protein E7598_00865 [Ruminococcaceae bacterium]|nr:hypothetical protein [Oscillospiraceae bacterium]
MTAQIGDRFKFDKSEFTMVAISEPLSFDPSKYGITPESVSTACWRGFWCVYNITDKGIFLEDLYINSKDDYYPEIEGVKPFFEEDRNKRFAYMGHHLYKGLNIKLDYTGKILVGDGFIHEYYIHMGYQRAWAYKKLVELVFADGNLIEKNDHSKVAADIRKKIRNDKDFDQKLHMDIPKFVEDSFSLDYKTKAWWL